MNKKKTIKKGYESINTRFGNILLANSPKEYNIIAIIALKNTNLLKVIAILFGQLFNNLKC